LNGNRLTTDEADTWGGATDCGLTGSGDCTFTVTARRHGRAGPGEYFLDSVSSVVYRVGVTVSAADGAQARSTVGTFGTSHVPFARPPSARSVEYWG
jgi:hypothetical protein